MRTVSEGLRRAASAIVARDGDDGIEVLVLERGGESRFLPGYVAFPGGSLEPEDDRLAGAWFGSSGEAARACAVRELVEEVGLALTADGLAAADGRSLAAVGARPPHPEQLREVAHWIAPPQVPVRFDARYFAVGAPSGLEPDADGVETADAWWVSPRRLLDDSARGERKLYWPTYFTLRAIAPCTSSGDLLGLRIETREPDDDDLARLPRSTFWQD
jgi:8-oxo-dGTP pyrophosphatase MutT (NUDIX family)